MEPASEPCDAEVSALSAAAIPITGKPANKIPMQPPHPPARRSLLPTLENPHKR